MSKKYSIIIIIIVILLLFVGLIFLLFSSNGNNNSTTVNTQTSSSPFGNNSSNKTSTTTAKIINNQSASTTKNLADLIQLYRNPTSGSTFFSNKNGQSILRFVDRAVGNIYEYVSETQTGEVTRITNTTIPKIQEAIWSSTGSNLIYRFLENDTDNINSFSSIIKISSSSISSGSQGEITGQFLQPNIKQVVISPKGDKVFGLLDKSDKSGSYGFIENIDGSNPKMIFDSQLLYWNISWPKDNIITFTTKPNYIDSGSLYFFNPQTYSMDKIFGGIIGLSTITNKDGSLLAYSHSLDKSFLLNIYDVKNRISSDLSVATLADKCVWGNTNSKVLYCAVPQDIPSDNYPDAWYQGLESFSDNIWKIDVQTGSVTEIYQIGSNESVSIDAFNLTISNNDKYLAFTNKNDLSLWLLQIK